MEDIFEFLIKGFFRFFVYILKEILFELLVKGPGYLITRSYTSKKDIDVDGWEVAIWGIAFWLLVGLGWALTTM